MCACVCLSIRLVPAFFLFCFILAFLHWFLYRFVIYLDLFCWLAFKQLKFYVKPFTSICVFGKKLFFISVSLLCVSFLFISDNSPGVCKCSLTNSFGFKLVCYFCFSLFNEYFYVILYFVFVFFCKLSLFFQFLISFKVIA